MKKTIVLTLAAALPLICPAVVLVPPPLSTNSQLVKLSLNRDYTANAIVRVKEADGLESLHQWLYSCRSGSVIERKIAGSDLRIETVTPFPERALRISATQVINGRTNVRRWIVTELCDLIPLEAFGAFAPTAISQDGKLAVGSLSGSYVLNSNRFNRPASISAGFGLVFDGQKFQTIATFVRILEFERWQAIRQNLEKYAVCFAAGVMLTMMVVMLRRVPLVRQTG